MYGLYSRKQQWTIFLVINGILLFVLLAFPFYYKYIKDLPFNRCYLVELFHIYCPSCGGTRAFKALCEFNILKSLWYNPIVPIGAGFFIAYEIYMIKHLIKKTERETFVKMWMVYSFLGVWGLFFIVRTILLFCGIDMIGDIL